MTSDFRPERSVDDGGHQDELVDEWHEERRWPKRVSVVTGVLFAVFCVAFWLVFPPAWGPKKAEEGAFRFDVNLPERMNNLKGGGFTGFARGLEGLTATVYHDRSAPEFREVGDSEQQLRFSVVDLRKLGAFELEGGEKIEGGVAKFSFDKQCLAPLPVEAETIDLAVRVSDGVRAAWYVGTIDIGGPTNLGRPGDVRGGDFHGFEQHHHLGTAPGLVGMGLLGLLVLGLVGYGLRASWRAWQRPAEKVRMEMLALIPFLISNSLFVAYLIAMPLFTFVTVLAVGALFVLLGFAAWRAPERPFNRWLWRTVGLAFLVVFATFLLRFTSPLALQAGLAVAAAVALVAWAEAAVWLSRGSAEDGFDRFAVCAAPLLVVGAGLLGWFPIG